MSKTDLVSNTQRADALDRIFEVLEQAAEAAASMTDNGQAVSVGDHGCMMCRKNLKNGSTHNQRNRKRRMHIPGATKRVAKTSRCRKRASMLSAHSTQSLSRSAAEEVDYAQA